MESPTTVLSWPSLVAHAITAIIAGILGYFLKWKKLPSEIDKTDAEADLTRAKAEELRVKTDLTAAEMMREVIADLNEAHFDKQRLREENGNLQERIHVLETQIEMFKANRKIDNLVKSEVHTSFEEKLS